MRRDFRLAAVADLANRQRASASRPRSLQLQKCPNRVSVGDEVCSCALGGKTRCFSGGCCLLLHHAAERRRNGRRHLSVPLDSVGMMSDTNRELVEFFISYKLSQRNHPASLLRPEGASGRTEGDKPDPAARNGLLVDGRGRGLQPAASDIEAVKAALRDSAEEFELLYTQAFSNLSSQLDITPDTAYHSFKSVMDEVFKDGVNWGRVVGLFAFGGVLCVECVEKDASELVSRIADWMTTYLDEHIGPWIQSQGGWDCFAEVFGRDAAAEARRSRETASRWLLVGVALLMGVVVGVLIAKKQ